MQSHELIPILPRGCSESAEERGPILLIRKVLWYIPVILHGIITFQFIQYLISNLPKILPKRFKQSKKFKIIGKVLMRIIQMLILTIFSIQVVSQFILFRIHENLRLSCNYTSFNNDTIEEILFVSDFIDSIISLGSCYFIFINSDIFEEIKFRNPLASSTKCDLSFPTGKNKIFSGIAIVSAYSIIITLPFVMACNIIDKFENLSWVNTYIEMFPSLIQEKFGTTNNTSNLVNEDKNLWYKCLTHIITLHWHMGPVFACITVRYMCVELQYQVETAVSKSKGFIKSGNIENWRLGIQRPIIAFYELTSRVKKYSKIAHYVATINIIAVIIILTSLFSSYVGSNNIGFTQKLTEIGKNNDKIYVLIAFRTPFIYVYQFISVWLMSDAIIAINTKLEKFSDSIFSEDSNAITHFLTEEGLEKFKEEMKLELSMISGSKERFEIAFLGDFSISVFHTIIPFGVGAMINFIIRAIDAMPSLKCDNF